MEETEPQTDGQPVDTAPDQAGADATPPADVAPPPADVIPPADMTPPPDIVAVPDVTGLEGQIIDLVHSATFLPMLAVFVLAIFVGYYVVWNVTPALHSPLMAVTNAISSVIIVGALIAAGLYEDSISTIFGFLAVVLASVNIFGGFLVTRRMLAMYKKKVR